jgi:hypothetical protein
MSIEAQSVEAQVFDELKGYAEDHFGETFLGKILAVGDYDPTRETHNFDNTFFNARPEWYTSKLLTGVACCVTKRGPRGLHRLIVEPFGSQAEEIEERLDRGKLMVITGHQNVLEPGLAMLGLQRAVVEQTGRNYAEVANETHLTAAKALLVVDILGRWPLASLARQMTNVHGTFPTTKKYRETGSIPLAFQRDSNKRMLARLAELTDARGKIGVTAVPATTEHWNKKIGRNVIPKIRGDAQRGTMGLLMQGWDILPVGGIFKHGFSIEPSEIIPAKDVTPDILHGVMESVIVASRERHGLPSVYAAA